MTCSWSLSGRAYISSCLTCWLPRDVCEVRHHRHSCQIHLRVAVGIKHLVPAGMHACSEHGMCCPACQTGPELHLLICRHKQVEQSQRQHMSSTRGACLTCWRSSYDNTADAYGTRSQYEIGMAHKVCCELQNTAAGMFDAR